MNKILNPVILFRLKYSNNFNFIFVIVLLTLLLGVISVLPFLFVAIFNQPSADDFCNFNYASTQDYFNNLTGWYLRWTGRYSQISFLYLMNKLGLFTAVKILTVFLILLHIHSTYYLGKQFFSAINRMQVLSFFALPVCFFFYSIMPNISQGLYWLASSSPCFISWIGITYYIAIIYNYDTAAISRLQKIYC